MSKKKTEIEIEEVRLCEIRLDKTQSRAQINAEAVHDYAEILGAGGELPPMIVYFDGSEYWMGDGFHRHGAACNVGWEAYPCEVRKGDWKDALRFSCGANGDHGVRRTNEDKRFAVQKAFTLDGMLEMSDRYVADVCLVSAWLVSDVRRTVQVQDSGTCPKNNGKTRVGKDKKRYDVPPRKNQAATAEAADDQEDDDFDPPPLPVPERQLGEGDSLEDVQADLKDLNKRLRQLAKDIRSALRCEGDEITRPFCGCYSLVSVQHPINQVARILMNDLPVGGTPKKPVLFHEAKAKSIA